MLRVDPAKPWLRRRERPDRPLEVPGTRPGGQEQRQDRRLWLGPSGSPAYNSESRSAKWEIPAEGDDG